MKLKMKFQSDNGKEFDDAVRAADEDHRSNVRIMAHRILNEKKKPHHVWDDDVNGLVEALLSMERIGFPEIVRYIENSRKLTNRDAAEFARNSEEVPDENSDFACFRVSDNGRE